MIMLFMKKKFKNLKKNNKSLKKFKKINNKIILKKKSNQNQNKSLKNQDFLEMMMKIL